MGAAGFSSGGYTSAGLVGAGIDGALLLAVLDGRVPIPDLPKFPGLLDSLRACVPDGRRVQAMAEADGDHADARVRAAFLVCPANGELPALDSLTAVDRPVEIRWGDADTITPPGANALRYLNAIPPADGRSADADVERGHFLSDNPVDESTRRQVASIQLGGFSRSSRSRSIPTTAHRRPRP